MFVCAASLPPPKLGFDDCDCKTAGGVTKSPGGSLALMSFCSSVIYVEDFWMIMISILAGLWINVVICNVTL